MGEEHYHLDSVGKGDTATADVELKGREAGTRKLRVNLLQQRGAWKVDKVEGK